MVIVPSVDVRGGRVAYRGGVGADQDPRALTARYVAEGAEELHLVDLDGAEHGAFANLELLCAIARSTGVPCRLAGGIASLEQAQAAKEAGFAGVLFSSAVFGDEQLLRRCARVPGAIVEIEVRDGKLAPRGGAPEHVLLAKGMDAELAATTAALRGVRDLYVIDLSTDGRLGGPPLVLLEQLRRATGAGVSFHTGGGVRDLIDIRALAEWGAASVVVGRAFLEGRFTVAEARAACA
ncbi:MAG: HisA/HisF-related TIM barrel protein [Candidatus Limnocylindria bacterium]|nr:HisA/HisF-related TIM barrel protein [Candidatus Limnocylindria bacterium]